MILLWFTYSFWTIILFFDLLTLFGPPYYSSLIYLLFLDHNMILLWFTNSFWTIILFFFDLLTLFGPSYDSSLIYLLFLDHHMILLWFTYSIWTIIWFFFDLLSSQIIHRYTFLDNRTIYSWFNYSNYTRGRRGRVRMAWFTTTCAISAYHHWCCEFESLSGWGVQHCVISLSVICNRSVVFSGSSGFLHQEN